ncbi:MAG TPA: hypothetical protein VJU15_06385 [Gemmatimonadales bacterium]|nr:hypothetical protein [Gemmatimonadales bacterium]
MPGIVVVDNQAGRDSGLPAELAQRSGWEVAVATMPLPAQLTTFDGGVLVGTGDGAAEVTSYAGSVEDHRIWGIALAAPRFHTESVDLREELGYIRVPILIVKRGPDAETDRQAQIAAEECYCPVDVARADSDADLARVIAEFAATLALTQGTGASA